MFRKLTMMALLLLSGLLMAQDSSQITIDRIYQNRDFSSDWFGATKWLKDSNNYTALEKAEDDPNTREIIRYNAASGKRDILVGANDLKPSEDADPLSIYNYSWSDDDRYLLIFTNTRRVWRYHTRGDYWVKDLQSGNLRQLGQSLPESSLMFAKFSPDNDRVAYVSEHNIYVEEIASGAITQLTADGSETMINGTFDWVYEEELSLRDGFRWSPDGKSIAYWQLDASNIGVYYMLNTTDSIYSEVIPVQYPKVGTTNSAGRIGIIPASGGETTWMQIKGDPRNQYLVRMYWHPSGKSLYIQKLNRLQNHMEIMRCSAKNGQAKVIYSEKNNSWIDVHDDFKWVDKGKYFTWLSEKGEWQHIYLVSADGKKVEKVTDVDFDVISIVKIDDRNGWIYFIASPENAGQRYLYRVELKPDGDVERLSPADLPGTHRYSVSDNGNYAIHWYSNFNNPGHINLVDLPNHKQVRMFKDNAKLKATLEKLHIRDGEFFRIKGANGITYDGWRILPPDFDENKKYPVLFYIYGEPAGQTVLDRWGRGNMWHRMLTQKGYIVMSIDNRGTPAPRGTAWRKAIYKKIGTLVPEDQSAALLAIREKWDYVDKDRIAIWGWSGGGTMTLNMMFRHPDKYHVGLSVAPVTNERFYDTIYEERYMGLPQDDSLAYEESSAVNFAKNLEGDLLVVHGTGDDNVHYQNTEVLVNELIKHNKHFTMMAYPNRSHSIREGTNTSRHLYYLLTKFLTDHLPAGPQDQD
jgi:dipeptidyl-peptidase-4